jgi:hypothetical protein
MLPPPICGSIDAGQTNNTRKPATDRQTELTKIATTLEANYCQPPVIFLGHLRDKNAILCNFFILFLTISRLKGPLP